MGLLGADDAIWAAVEASAIATRYADCWAPMTEMIAWQMGNGVGGPFAVNEGAAAWRDAGSKLGEAKEQLTELVGALPRDYWTGDDRAAFDSEMSDLEAQLEYAQIYAEIVAITLQAQGIVLAYWPVMCGVIGVGEAAYATAFYAAAASIVGDLGPSEALFASGEAFTAGCLSVMETSTAILTAAMEAGAAAIAVGDLMDVIGQSTHGDPGVIGEFGKATVDSLPAMAVNGVLGRKGKTPSLSRKGEDPIKGAYRRGNRKIEDHEGRVASAEQKAGRKGATKADRKAAERARDRAGDARHSAGDGVRKSVGKVDRKGSMADEAGKGAQDIGKTKVGENAVEPSLQSLINGLTGNNWNRPDAPSADDEGWGAGDDGGYVPEP